MKFGFRKPSLKKRISARISWKRYIRHNLGLKAPRGWGILTNPKKYVYNKIYNRTTFGVEDIIKMGKKKKKTKNKDTPKADLNLDVSNDSPFVFTPQSFNNLINSDEKSGRLKIIGLLIFFGFIFLSANPLIGTLMIIGGICWWFMVSRSSHQKVKRLIQKAKKLLRKNKFENALKFLDKAKKIEPANPLLSYLLGVTQHAVGDYEQAEGNLYEYVEENPNDSDSNFLLALNHYNLEDFERAVPILQKIHQTRPDNLYVILLLGDCFINLGKFDLAVNVIKRGPLRKRNLDKQLLLLHYLLGKAYKKLGEESKALKEFKKIYAFDINYRDVVKQIEEIEG